MNSIHDSAQVERQVDNLIIGSGFVGCIAAWILAREKMDGILLEKSATLGGGCRSFQDPAGNFFDYGRHALHYARTDLATRFFMESLAGKVRRFAVSRGLLLQGTLLPYGRPLEQWPSRFGNEIQIDLEAPRVGLGTTREGFTRVYGRWFTDLIFDEVLPSFQPLQWRLKQGAAEHELLDWIFPWFFPRSECEAAPDPSGERGVFSAESRQYHYDTRHSDVGEEMLYPTTGKGFGDWIESMLGQCGSYVDIRAGQESLDFDFDPDTRRLLKVRTADTTYVPKRVFWCAPIAILAKTFGWTLPRGEPQTFLLGSFTFDRPLPFKYHEILGGDPDHRISRISFPGFFAGDHDGSSTVQIEYLTLKQKIEGISESEWTRSWEKSLRDLGLVDRQSRLLHSDVKRLEAGFATETNMGEFAQKCRVSLQESGTNLIAPALTFTPDNLSRQIPIIFEDVYQSLGISAGERAAVFL